MKDTTLENLSRNSKDEGHSLGKHQQEMIKMKDTTLENLSRNGKDEGHNLGMPQKEW